MTASGPMREVIRLQVQTSVQDGTGQPNLVWADLTTRRAEKTQTPGAEVQAAAELVGRVPTVFRIRYPRTIDLSPKLRVVHRELGRDRVYEVRSRIDPDGRRVDMLLTCEELVGESA